MQILHPQIQILRLQRARFLNVNMGKIVTAKIRNIEKATIIPEQQARRAHISREQRPHFPPASMGKIAIARIRDI